MLFAILTISAIASASTIIFSIKGALPVDENLNPIEDKQEAAQQRVKEKQPKQAVAKSMTFLDFSKSRSIA